MKKSKYQKFLDGYIIAFMHGFKLKIRPIEKSGSGSYSKYSVDHTKQYTEYLDKCRMNYEIGNDAPYGGSLGKYIIITGVKK